MKFDAFFQSATGNQPYGYQSRLAGGDSGITCNSQLINIPTGLGKTAAVVLAWLWNRVHLQNPKWPRRLVYCLPMRTLVEQTRDEVAVWLGRLALLAAPENSDAWLRVRKVLVRLPTGMQSKIAGFRAAGAFAEEFASFQEELVWLFEHSPVILMGGEDTGEWDIHPEKPAILIGTQDMLLSRALNRGYGMSRYRWPMHFGLLNNDCLWVMDETQLMGVGLETSVQLAGFRDRFGTFCSCAHWWMSATLNPVRLATPEAPPLPPALRLTDAEQTLPTVQRRLTATKRLRAADTKFEAEISNYASSLAGEVRSAHVPGTLTLVIVNTVGRAQELYRALKKLAGDTPLTLLHSRFRPQERRERVRRVLETPGDHLVISTQVIEAGADISARTLFTELAPWSSLVQRFGRCHRHGELGESGADIRWLNLPEKESAPYEADELDKAKVLLEQLTDVSLASLANVPAPVVAEPPRHIIRPKDLRELFDTTPDIAGADLDVSRFIREGDDTDCTAFWRIGDPALIADGPLRDELCPVPVAQFYEFASKHLKTKVWIWDALSRQWAHPDHIIPGREYWLDASLGGYDPVIGWDRRSKIPVVPVLDSGPAKEAHDDDWGTMIGIPETLEAHTTAVVSQAQRLCSTLVLPSPLAETLRLAAVWHDAGKAHFAFQEAMRKANPELSAATLWAKSGVRTRLDFGDRSRFRHELASALAFRASDVAVSTKAALVAFLIAAHHGKVRLSLRALPDERGDKNAPDRLFARGIRDGDELPPLVLDGKSWPKTILSLAPMQLGLGQDEQPSWLEACLGLRDSPDFGAFRLAFAETLLRAADQRASQESDSE